MAIREKYSSFINGSFVEPQSGEYRASVSPISQKPVTQIAWGNASDVSLAVTTAKQAAPAWRSFKPAQRAKILFNIAQKLRENVDNMAGIESAETGKPAFQTPFEVEGAAAYFEFYAGLVNLPAGDVINMGAEYHCYSLREPFGVVGVITPWNAPLNQAARSIAPALAAGNTVVAKPSEFTSASTVELAAIAHQCGLPDGVLNVVLGDGVNVGAEIVKHPDISKLAFTGSLRAGKEIGSVAAERVIPVTLELGGKSANIIFDDADLANAIPGALRAFVGNAGQVCSAGSRLLVHESVIDTVVQGLKKAAATIVPGEHIGAMTTPAQYQKVCDYFAIAEQEKLQCVCGGSAIENDAGSFLVPPTIYIASPESRLYREEIFGPVLVVTPFADETQAITMANASEYGLAAGLWTTNISRAHRVASALEAGQVYVNDWVAGGIEAPFGGYKQSGIGREKGIEALHHYSQLKSVIVKL